MGSARRPRAVRTLGRQPPPPGIYRSSYDPQLAMEICARLAAGESLRALCRDDPAMPTEKTVWNWARAHPEFAALRAWAIKRARAVHRRRRARAAPSKTGRRAWNRGRSGYSPELASAICARLCLGEPLYKLCRDAGMPSVGTVYNWLRDHPPFVEAYRRAKAVAFEAVMDEAIEGAPAAGDGRGLAAALRRAEKAGLRRCAWLAPKGYAEGIYGVLPPVYEV